MVLKPLGENRSESRNTERILDLRHDVVCSCSLALRDLRVAAPTRLDHRCKWPPSIPISPISRIRPVGTLLRHDSIFLFDVLLGTPHKKMESFLALHSTGRILVSLEISNWGTILKNSVIVNRSTGLKVGCCAIIWSL